MVLARRETDPGFFFRWQGVCGFNQLSDSTRQACEARIPIIEDGNLHDWGGAGDVANCQFHPVTPAFCVLIPVFSGAAQPKKCGFCYFLTASIRNVKDTNTTRKRPF
jgi:hypothetical protein